MDLNTSSIDDGGEGSKEQIVLATREIKKAHSRNRRKRAKVLSHVVEYLDGIIPATYEQHKNYVLGTLVESMDELRDLFLEVFKLLLSLLEQGSQGLGDTIQYDASNYATILESFVVHLKQWCITQAPTTDREPTFYFLDLTSHLLTGIVDLVAESESWRYVEFINTPVTFIILQWGFAAGPEASDKLLQWTQSTAYSIKTLEKRICQCGDFECQYFLMTLIQQWLAWAGRQTAENYLETAFPPVSLDFRRHLLEIQDFDYGGRTFLNALNENISTGPRARGIFSIRCLHFFAGDEQLNQPEESDQLWIDFSSASRRIHAFISLPTNSWISWNISSEHVESICVSWLRRGDGGRSQLMSESCTQAPVTQDDFTQMSALSNMETSCLMFLHIQLKDNFSDTNQDLSEFHDKDIRSLTLVFQDLSMVEKVLYQMSFPTHSNGTECVRPQGLLDIIEGKSESSVLPEPDTNIPDVSEVEQISPITSDIEVVPESLALSCSRSATPAARSSREVQRVSNLTPYPAARPSPGTQGTEKENEYAQNSVASWLATPGRRQSQENQNEYPQNSVSSRLATPGRRQSQEKENEYSQNSVSSRLATPGRSRSHSREVSAHPARGTPHPLAQASAENSPYSHKENSAKILNHTPRPRPHELVEVIETPGGFHVPMTSSEESEEEEYNAPGSDDMFSSEEDEEDELNQRKARKIRSARGSLNVTMESMMEDPIPRSVRERISSREGSGSISPKSPSIIQPGSPLRHENVREIGRDNKTSDIALFKTYEKNLQSPYPRSQIKRKRIPEKDKPSPPINEFAINSDLSPSPSPPNDENVKEKGKLDQTSDISLFQTYEKTPQSPYPRSQIKRKCIPEKATSSNPADEFVQDFDLSPSSPKDENVKEKGKLNKDSDISLFQTYEKTLESPYPTNQRKPKSHKCIPEKGKSSTPINDIAINSDFSPSPSTDKGKEKGPLNKNSDISLFQTYEKTLESPYPKSQPKKKSIPEKKKSSRPRNELGMNFDFSPSPPPPTAKNLKEKGKLNKNSGISLFQTHEKTLESPHPRSQPKPKSQECVPEKAKSSTPADELGIDSDLSLFLSDEESCGVGLPQTKERKKKPAAAPKRQPQKQEKNQQKPSKNKTTKPAPLESNVRGRARKKQPAVRIVQTKLSVTHVEHNPVPKVSGRSPCYRSSPSRMNSSLDLDIDPVIPPLTQFKDPYDITADEDFLKERLTRTYSRKRKRKPVARSRSPRIASLLDKTASDEELEKLVEALPKDVSLPKKPRGRPRKQNPPKEKAPRKKPGPNPKPGLPKKKPMDIADDELQQEIVNRRVPDRPEVTARPKIKQSGVAKQKETEKIPKKKPTPRILYSSEDDDMQQEIGNLPETTTTIPKIKQSGFPKQKETERVPKAKPKPRLPDKDIFEGSDDDMQQEIDNPLEAPAHEMIQHSKPQKEKEVERITKKKPIAEVEILDSDDEDDDRNQEIANFINANPTDQTFDWENFDLDLEEELEREKQSSFHRFKQGTPTPPTKRGRGSRPTSVCSGPSRRPAPRPATPKPKKQQEQDLHKKVIPRTPRRNLDDTFDWSNIDLDLE